MIPVKCLKLEHASNLDLPSYATLGSAGMDLRAAIAKPIVLKHLERKAIPTGICLELPNGLEAQIRPRSGLAINYGISVLNAPGTIDCDYRGEIKVILINLGDKDFTVNCGDKIAQMVISAYEKVALKEVSDLSDTSRGTKGFGSTGVN